MYYHLMFEDGTEFEGGSPDASKWSEIPLKRIVSLKYVLGEHCIKLYGFEGYNHIVEHIKVVQTGECQITKLILMAKTENRVFRIWFDFQTYKIHQDKVFFGQEYMEKPVSGWKAGYPAIPNIKVI